MIWTACFPLVCFGSSHVKEVNFLFQYMGLFVAMMFLPAMACVIPFGIIAFTIGLPLFLPIAMYVQPCTFIS